MRGNQRERETAGRAPAGPAAPSGPRPAAGDRETAVVTSDRLELKVWLRLLTCSNMIERMVRRRLRDTFAITLPRFDLLAQLDRAPAGLTMGELSRRLMVTNGNVTGLIDRLVGEGLVARRPVPGDRRTQIVRLTPRGKRVFDSMTPVHQRWVREAMADMDREALETLYRSLAELKGSLESRLETPAPARRRGPEPAGTVEREAAR